MSSLVERVRVELVGERGGESLLVAFPHDLRPAVRAGVVADETGESDHAGDRVGGVRLDQLESETSHGFRGPHAWVSGGDRRAKLIEQLVLVGEDEVPPLMCVPRH